MKALTVQQPWAWAIIHGGKLIENRTRLWSHRGPLAIHAGTRQSERGIYDPRVGQAFANWVAAQRLDYVPADMTLPGQIRGVILGVVQLVDCHPDTGCCRPWGESDYTEHGGRQRPTVTHLVLENPRALSDPIPCKGALGLWTPPAHVLTELEGVTADA